MLLLSKDIKLNTEPCDTNDIAVRVFFEKSYLSSRIMQTISKLPSVGGIYKSKPDYPYLLIDFGVDSQTDVFGLMIFSASSLDLLTRS